MERGKCLVQHQTKQEELMKSVCRYIQLRHDNGSVQGFRKMPYPTSIRTPCTFGNLPRLQRVPGFNSRGIWLFTDSVSLFEKEKHHKNKDGHEIRRGFVGVKQISHFCCSKCLPKVASVSRKSQGTGQGESGNFKIVGSIIMLCMLIVSLQFMVMLHGGRSLLFAHE